MIDLISLDHNTGHISTEKVIVAIRSETFRSEFFLSCSTWAILNNNLFMDLTVFFCNTLSSQRVLGQDYRLISDSLNLLGELFDSIFTFLESLVELLIDKDMVFVRVFKVCILLLECFEISSSPLQFFF